MSKDERTYTDLEEILRIAYSGDLWVFMSEDHHEHIRKNLASDPLFWIEGLDADNPPQDTMEQCIAKAEELGLDPQLSDDRTALILEKEDTEEPIHFMLIEIPDDEDDNEEDDVYEVQGSGESEGGSSEKAKG